MKIRESTIADAGQIAYCISEVARERQYLASTGGFSLKGTKEFLQSLKISGGIHLICVENELVIGWADVFPGVFEGFKHSGRLGMGLLHGYRSKGYGSRLLQSILLMAFEKNFKRIELDVFASNKAAIALYEKFGFIKEGVKRKARKLDGHYDDIVIYGLLKNEFHSPPDPESDKKQTSPAYR